MSSVKIKVNTYNRLKKIREGVVYDSITTVIDELLQNCQRTFRVSDLSGSQPVIDVVVKDDTIIIRDNGNGCEDPQSIFEFETSGWDIKDAFGQGGSESVFQIADYFEIYSRDWKAKVDVLGIMETGNFAIPVDHGVEYLNGYQIMLKGQKIADKITTLKLHIIKVLQHYPYNCYVNGEQIEYKDLQSARSVHTVQLENDFYSATFGIQTSYTDIEVFYEKRKVMDKWFRGALGVIELKPGAVNLKAPDRKSMIYDDKSRAFDVQLREDIKFLYLSFVSQATPEQFDKYVNEISDVLKAVDYIDYLPFYEEGYDTIKSLSKEVANSEDYDSLKDFAETVDENSYGTRSYGTMVPATIDVNETGKTRLKYKRFKDEVLKYVNTVWIENNSDKLKEYSEVMEKLKSCGIKVLVSKNKLYDKAFEHMKLPHISEVTNKSESSYIVGGVSGGYYLNGQRLKAPESDISKKEDRILYVLSYIEQHYNVRDVFRIADVKEHIYVGTEEKVMIDILTRASSTPLKDNGKIYLDRKSLNLGKVDLPTSKARITKFDVLVIMLNIQTIAGGLSKMIYGTIEGTVEHYNKTEKISKEVAMLLATL